MALTAAAIALFAKMKKALAVARTPKRQRYVVVGTRTDGVKIQGKGGTLTPRVLQRVMDLRNVKPREQRKGKPWRHNETTSARKRWLREHAGLA